MGRIRALVITFSFDDVVMELPRIRDNNDLLVGVVASFSIKVGTRVLFSEGDFPIVELRVQLAQWHGGGSLAGKNFELDSLESDEPGIVWIRRSKGGGWRVGSIWQEYAESRDWTDDELATCLAAFAKDVDAWVSTELHVDLSERFGLS
jgi:hypothetical protein